MVRRSYVWHKLVYGVICKITEEKYTIEASDLQDIVELTATIAWSDGTISNEMLAELELMENDIQNENR